MKLTQVLKTIQGELNGIGHPIILVRVTGCNLRCSWCDAYESSHEEKVAIEDNDLINLANSIIDQKGSTTTILLTGGEPTLYLTEQYKTFFNELANVFDRFIIETNGLGSPEQYEPTYLKKFFKGSEVHLDCSPKINFDAYSLYKNIKNFDDILNLYKKTIPTIMKNKNYMIKMVYSPTYADKILKFKEIFKIPFENFCLLPLTPVFKGETEHENFLLKYRESCRKTVEFCIEHDIIYSPREHIFLYYDNKGEHEDLIKRKEV